MKNIKIETNKKSIKILFIILIIILALPSTIYVINEKNISNFWGYSTIAQYFSIPPLINGILFFVTMGLISLLYVLIISNYKKIFTNKKETCIFIVIVAILFTIILPITSTDIFYYIATRME